MRKLLIALIAILAFANVSRAQTSDLDLVKRFMDAVIERNIEELDAVLKPSRLDDIPEIIQRGSVLFDSQGWEYIGSYHDGRKVRYYFAIKIGSIPTDRDWSVASFVLPAGYIVGFEWLCVVMENGRKYVDCNGDLVPIMEVESNLREVGKTIPSKYFTEWDDRCRYLYY